MAILTSVFSVCNENTGPSTYFEFLWNTLNTKMFHCWIPSPSWCRDKLCLCLSHLASWNRFTVFYNEQLTHWCRSFSFGLFYNGRRPPEFASECQVALLCSLPHNSHSHSWAAMNGSANPCITYITRQPYSHIHTTWFWFYQHCCHVACAMCHPHLAFLTYITLITGSELPPRPPTVTSENHGPLVLPSIATLQSFQF